MDARNILLIFSAAVLGTATGFQANPKLNGKQYTEIRLTDNNNIDNEMNKEKWLALFLNSEGKYRRRRSVDNDGVDGKSAQIMFNAAAAIKARRVHQLEKVLFGREIYRRKRVHVRDRRNAKPYQDGQTTSNVNNANDGKQKDEIRSANDGLNDNTQNKNRIKDCILNAWILIINFFKTLYKKIFYI